ncbi:hypothetical protein CA267_018325 [Alteromonas pelagimontana]|uniref:Lipoprotein n=1 Tax=Alteromonas pelagimontana TaxID=1858656 RepID=A0A6M4MHI2_9ALTE|nr:DUF6279 family lipoprotein [Alteromonas pelagimontana]QJR82569.1 hypothetical protein CA267_018325 [Alteromonas pelagimontana]
MKNLLMGLGLMFLAGCSSKLAYNNLDWLVYWYMDDYIELNDAQEKAFDKKLSGWLDWHRSQELQKYIEQLKTLRTDVENDNLTESQLLKHLSEATDHWHRVRNKLAPQLAAMAEKLEDEQVIRLFAALEADNKEEEEELQELLEESEEEQAKDHLEDMEEDMEERLGDLTHEQKAIIARFSPRFTSTHAEWLQYRRDTQQAARKLFATRQSNPDFVADLTYVMTHPDEYRSESYQQHRAQNRELYAQMAAAIAKTLTPEQKHKLLREINDTISDFEGFQQDD